MTQSTKMFTQSELLAMGWSKGLIDKLLPKPILKSRGPNLPPSKLWYASSVYKQMRLSDFKAAKAGSKDRKASAKKAVATKEQKLIQRATELAAQLEIRIIDDDELRMNAIENWERHYFKSEPFMEMLERADNATKERWIVNYIRHRLINYDEECQDLLYGKTGCNAAYIVFKKAILLRIAEVYPKYADACNIQYQNVRVPKWKQR